MKMFGKDSRSVRMQKNVILSLILKVWVALITFLQVPLVLNILGEYQNGIWLTISSLLVWIDIMDIGLGNGLRNKLAEAIANEDYAEARKMVSSTFAMLCLIILPILFLLILAISWGDMYAFFNVEETQVCRFDNILIAAVSLVAGTFIFKFIGNLYMGLQLPAVSNALQAGGMTLALLGTYALLVWNAGSLASIVIVNTAAPLVMYLLAFPYTFFIRYPKLRPSLLLISRKSVISLSLVGIKFFVIQAASLLLFASSNILISRLYNPAMVTPFQIAYRYTTILVTGFSIIAMPIWSATTDAYTRGDMKWIADTNRRMGHIMMAFIAGAVLMVILSSPFYRLWIGDGIHIPLSYTILLVIYVLIVICSTRYSYFLNGIGALRLQLVTTVFCGVLFFLSNIIAAHFTNTLILFILIMILTQLPGLIINAIQFQKIIHGTAKGWWIE